MKYTAQTAHGDAGEFFFAFKIASVLRWPCRLFDIDIGIDAQVEVLNNDGASTGRFVAFQVKATNLGAQEYWYVSRRQLSYWRELDLPVFVVLVDLLNEEMYLHQVHSNKKYRPATEKGFVRINFDLVKDKFSEQSGKRIAAAAEEAALSHIRKHLCVVQEGIQEIQATMALTETSPEPERLIELMEERTVFRKELAQATALVRALRAGEEELEMVSTALIETLDELRSHMQDWGMHRDWDHHGNIIRFIEETN